MPEKSPLRIFISYGHDEYAELAERIKNDLHLKGYDSWFDRNRIQPGNYFDCEIEKGLIWLTEDKSRARFLYLMTPHSVRRPNGFCLNELAFAMMKELSIFPVMVQMCEPPLSICRIQWFDMQECFPPDEKADSYLESFKKLLQALEDDNWDFEGSTKSLLAKLDPIDFGPDMLRHLKDFTGREWLKKEIEEWLEGKRPGNKQVFWIKGKPGIGKTAISSWLASTMYEVVAAYFFRSDSPEKRDPVRFIHNLVYHMSTQVPEYREQLYALTFGVDHYLEKYKNDPNDLFNNLVILPLYRAGMKDRKTLAVVIDGLDEASEESGDNEIARLIARQLEKAPSWLKFIVTSRSEAGINAELQGVTNPCELDSASEENEKDIREYLKMKLKPYLEEAMDEEKIILEILQKSEGLFVYVNAFMKALEEKALTLKDVGNFPGKLGEIFYKYFSSKFKDSEEYTKKTIPILRLLVAATKPLGIELFGKILDLEEEELFKNIRKLGSFFESSKNGLIPFHSTLKQWLICEHESNNYYVSKVEGHKRFAKYGLEQFEKIKARKAYEIDSDYAVSNIGIHLYEASMDEQLYKLLLEIVESDGEFNWKHTIVFNTFDYVLGKYNFEKEERLKGILKRLSQYILHKEDSNYTSLKLINKIYEEIGQYEKALEYTIMLVDISEGLVLKDPDSISLQKEMSLNLDNAGKLHKKQNKYDDALKCYIRSLRIIKSLFNKNPYSKELKRMLVASLNNIASIYEKLGKDDLVEQYRDKSIEIMSRRLEDSEKVNLQINQGVMKNETFSNKL